MRTLFVLGNDTHPFLSRPVATVTEAFSFVCRNLRWVGGGQVGEGAKGRLAALKILGSFSPQTLPTPSLPPSLPPVKDAPVASYGMQGGGVG